MLDDAKLVLESSVFLRFTIGSVCLVVGALLFDLRCLHLLPLLAVTLARRSSLARRSR